MMKYNNFKTLSKIEMKSIKGGDADGEACSNTYQTSNGEWVTEYGKCATYTHVQNTFFSTSGYHQPFCQTTSFQTPVPLTSNGGVSKCGKWYPLTVF